MISVYDRNQTDDKFPDSYHATLSYGEIQKQ